MLAACTTTASKPLLNADQITKDSQRRQLDFGLASGIYTCEFGLKINIQRNLRDANLIDVNWQGTRYTLQRYASVSGLPRYEDRANGLMWIDLPWKGVLMDIVHEQPLANECKMASN